MDMENTHLDHASSNSPRERVQSPLRMKYTAEVSLIKGQFGDLEQIRLKLGLSQRKICQLLLVDPSAWTRWTSHLSVDAPPHIYRSLSWYLILQEKNPEISPYHFLQTVARPQMPSSEVKKVAEKVELQVNALFSAKLQNLHQQNSKLKKWLLFQGLIMLFVLFGSLLFARPAKAATYTQSPGFAEEKVYKELDKAVRAATAAICSEEAFNSSGATEKDQRLLHRYTVRDSVKNMLSTKINATPDQIKMCKDYPELNNSNSGCTCSSFLVAPKIVATAGHCLGLGENQSLDCNSKLNFVFGLDSVEKPIAKQKIFKCNQVLYRQNKNGTDLALIELDGTPEGVKPLPMKTTSTLKEDDALLAYGHPFGQALESRRGKFVSAHKNLTNIKTDQVLQNRISTNPGMSGGPVVNENDYSVECVLITTMSDFEGDLRKGCFKKVVIKEKLTRQNISAIEPGRPWPEGTVCYPISAVIRELERFGVWQEMPASQKQDRIVK